MDEFATNNLL